MSLLHPGKDAQERYRVDEGNFGWNVRDRESTEDVYEELTEEAAQEVARLLNRADRLVREDWRLQRQPPESASGCCDTWEEHRGER